MAHHDSESSATPPAAQPGLPPIQQRLCAGIAASESQDPIGTATAIDRLLTVEISTPWTRSGADSDPDGSIPERVMAAQRRSRASADRDPAVTRGRIYGVAPDDEWSSFDTRRLLLAQRAPGSGTYEMVEYRFPANSPRIVDFVESFLDRPYEVASYDAYRVERPDVVEFLVCTHGRRDACCAKFGMPLFRQARAHGSGVRAWRTMHFGGHRYAPTAWEFPSGYKWGFLTESAAASVLERGDLGSLGKQIRGWSGTSRVIQPLDRVGFLEHGWEWLGFARSGSVLDSQKGPTRHWRVRMEFESPAGLRGTYEGTTRVGRQLRSVGCGADWGAVDGVVDELELDSYELVTTGTSGGA